METSLQLAINIAFSFIVEAGYNLVPNQYATKDIALKLILIPYTVGWLRAVFAYRLFELPNLIMKARIP